jgi:lipopolysaccharide transport system permease protein
LDFQRALVSVPGPEAVRIPGVRAELGDARRQALEQADERLRRDRVRIRSAGVELPVEVAAESNARVEMAEGNLQLLRQLEEGGPDLVEAVPVMVRIEVGGIMSDEPAETVELPKNLARHIRGKRSLGLHAAPEESPDTPALELHVKAQVELGMTSGVRRCRIRCGRVDHEARAGHDAVLVCLHGAPVDPVAQAEVVGVDDEGSRVGTRVNAARGDRQVFAVFQGSVRKGLRRRGYSSRVQTEQEAAPIARASNEATLVRRAADWLARSADLLLVLMQSDLRFRYGRGPWRFIRWLFDPIALVGVYLLLVTFILDRPGRAVGLSLTCAVVPFQLVMLTIGNAMTTLDARRPILLNMAFRRMLLPFSSALTESAGFGSSLFLLVAMMAIYRIGPTWNILWFPIVLLVNLVLAAAAAYPAILLGIWLRELRTFVVSFVRTLFFLGPGLVPLQQTSHGVRDVLRANPMTGLFEAYRDAFLYGRTPQAWELLFPLTGALVLLVLFVPIYRSEQRQFAKVV